MKKFQNKQYGFYGNVFDMEKVFKESEVKQNENADSSIQ